MKKEMEDADRKKKEEEKKDRRRKKEEKREGPRVKLGLEVDVEEPKAVKKPPKRGGCVSGSAGVGLAGNAQIGLHIDLSLAGDRQTPLHGDVLVAARDIPKDNIITRRDVGMTELKKGSRVQTIGQIVGRRAARYIHQGEVLKKGMVK